LCARRVDRLLQKRRSLPREVLYCCGITAVKQRGVAAALRLLAARPAAPRHAHCRAAIFHL
jgi:hypothetical protein